MLNQPLLDRLTALRLKGFRDALEEQQQSTQYADLSFEDRLGLLVDFEFTRRTTDEVQSQDAILKVKLA